jgi:hypothetical protein
MDQTISQILAEGSVAQLSGLVGLAIFFLIIGVREIKHEHPQGFFFLTLALFFVVGHFYQLSSLPDNVLALVYGENLGVWAWLVAVFAPALIALFIVRGLIGFAFSQGRAGMVRLFFGLTLICFIYMLGADWAVDVKGILTVVWLTVLFRLELDTADTWT